MSTAPQSPVAHSHPPSWIVWNACTCTSLVFCSDSISGPLDNKAGETNTHGRLEKYPQQLRECGGLRSQIYPTQVHRFTPSVRFLGLNTNFLGEEKSVGPTYHIDSQLNLSARSLSSGCRRLKRNGTSHERRKRSWRPSTPSSSALRGRCTWPKDWKGRGRWCARKKRTPECSKTRCVLTRRVLPHIRYHVRKDY